MINYITDQGGQRFPKAPNYNNEPIVPSINKEKAKAGDILLAKANGQKMFVTPEMWTENKDLYENIKDGSDPLWTPIGVVVVPYTHTPDGTVRCCAITQFSNINLNRYGGPTTSTGISSQQALDVSIKYYKDNTEEEQLKANPFFLKGQLGQKVILVPGTSTYSTAYVYFAVDGDNAAYSGYSGGAVPSTFYDPYVCYYRTSYDLKYTSDPYEGPDEHRAESFYLNKKIDYSASLDLRMDGKSATQFMYETFDRWYTTVCEPNEEQRESYQDLIPGLYAVMNKETVGTSAGDWYIPSVGEIAFLYSRMFKIRLSIKSVNEYYGDIVSQSVWTSTMCGLDSAPSNQIAWPCHVYVTSGWSTTNGYGTLNCLLFPFISV